MRMTDRHDQHPTSGLAATQLVRADDEPPADHEPGGPTTCGATAEPAADTVPPMDDVAEGGVATAAGVRRALKLVVTLRPADGRGYRALLALGADGCDPMFRAVEAADFAAALAEALPLLAEAEGRWRTRPRNATVAPRRTVDDARARASDAPTSAATEAAAAMTSAGPAPESPPPPVGAPAAARAARAGQLPLFA
jgi:hypothetical protein